MSRHREEQFEAPGKDSFLDVIANVVAILIILVIVVGSQAQQGVVRKAQAAAIEMLTPLEQQAVDAESSAAAVEASIVDLQRNIERQNMEVAVREQQRNQVQVLVTVAEQRLAEHRDKLSAAEREQYDLQNELVASRGELSKIGQAKTAAENVPPAVIQHLPTPMAKTVFGKEMHFRLLDNKLTFVPWDAMLEMLKTDAPRHVQKLQNAARVELSLPMVEGFGARYVLRRTDGQVQTGFGSVRQSRVELERIYFVDADSEMGEPVEQALQPGSQFRNRLTGMEPSRTTVTIWVYPNSFESYRTVKAELFKLGFLSAGRPLPDGLPIGGSPDGTRSSAE